LAFGLAKVFSSTDNISIPSDAIKIDFSKVGIAFFYKIILLFFHLYSTFKAWQNRPGLISGMTKRIQHVDAALN